MADEHRTPSEPAPTAFCRKDTVGGLVAADWTTCARHRNPPLCTPEMDPMWTLFVKSHTHLVGVRSHKSLYHNKWALLDSNQRPPACKECSKVTDSGDFRVEYGFFARSCPVRRRSIAVLNRSARCNRDAKRVGLRCGACLPHSGPQLRTSRTVDSWAWLGATEGRLVAAGGMRLKLCAHSQIVRSQNHWHNDCPTSSCE
jgi:hypothetical protein